MRKMFTAKITVKFKKNIKNPETQTLETLLKRLSIDEIKGIKYAKFYEFKIDAKNKSEAEKIAEELAKNILSNPIIEETEVAVSNE